MSNFNFYNPPKKIFQTSEIGETLKILVVTSLRDVAVTCQSGQFVNIDGIPTYMKGTLENLLEETNTNGNYAKEIQIVGVLIDDIPNKDNLENFSIFPEDNYDWIMPKEYIYRGVPIREMIYNCPSIFRKISLSKSQKRKAKKQEFESQIVQLAAKLSADIVLSDSLLVILKDVHHRIVTVNIHPAITNQNSVFCSRGVSPIEDILKKVEETGKTRTGASLHFINDNVDDGAVIADTDIVEVEEGWDSRKLRYYTYQQAKNPLLLEGLSFFKKQYGGLIEYVKKNAAFPSEYFA